MARGNNAPAPLFSIITICRNEQGEIRATCEGICHQKFRDFEWIVIDGASTDGTLDSLNEYRDAITLLVSESDAGIYNAMNKGVAHATGEYVIFMNGGDCFADDQVLQVVADAPQRDIIYGDLIFAGVDSTVKQYPDVLPSTYLLENMLPHQASFYKRELFEQYGVYDETFRIAGDYELFVRLLHVHHVSYFHITKALAIFDGEGISKNPKHRALRKDENHRVRKQYFPAYRYSLKGIRQMLRNGLRS